MPDPLHNRLGLLDHAIHQDIIDFETRSPAAPEVETNFSTFLAEFRHNIAGELFDLDLTKSDVKHLTTQPLPQRNSFQNQLPPTLEELEKWLLEEAPEVAQRFEIIRLIGTGGMGTVFEVRDIEREARLAMKILHHAVPELLLSFKREFRFLSDLAHPNLVRLYEFFHTNHLFCFTMELVEGIDLLTWWELYQSTTPNSGTLPLQNAFLQLAEGLNALHLDGKLHRDIKPSNVMVSSADSRVVLLDFGLVTNYADRIGVFNPGLEDFSGTLPYMAPEQMGGLPLAPACDWYAFGVILYEALAGCRPFAGSYSSIYDAKNEEIYRPLPETTPPHLDQLCRDLLCALPNDRPDGEAILEILLFSGADNPQPVSPAVSKRNDLTIIGRERELDLLRGALLDSLDGKPVLVTLHGNSGIGKSSVLQAFREELDLDLAGLSPMILSGRCYEKEFIPYKGIEEIVDQMSALFCQLPPGQLPAVLVDEFPILSAAFPTLGLVKNFHDIPLSVPDEMADPASQRRRMLNAFRNLLIEVSLDKPVVLLIDDLQWADSACIAIIKSALTHSQKSRLLIVVSYRREERDPIPEIRPLTGQRVDIPVDELDKASLALLAEEITGGPAKELDIAGMVESSNGSPFFLIQIASALAHGGGDLALEKVLENQVAELDPGERRFLELLAVAGRPLKRGIVIEAAELTEKNNHEVESDLRIARLIKSSGPLILDDVETYHDRIREGIIGALAPEVLASRHLRLAETLEIHEPGEHENLARHFRGGGKPEIAADYYLKAARASRQAFAFNHTAELYREALECAPRSGAELAGIREAMGDALANSGRGGDAAQQYHLAADLMKGNSGELALKQKEAHQYMISGRFDQGLSVLQEVLRHAGIPYPASHLQAFSSALVQTLWLKITGIPKPKPNQPSRITPRLAEQIDTCWVTGSGLGNIDLYRASDFHLRALRLSLRSGEPTRIARSLAFHTLYHAFAGTRARKRTTHLLELTEAFAAESNDSYSRAALSMAGSGTDMLLGQFENCVSNALEAESWFRKHGEGVTWEIDTVQIYRTISLLNLGKLNQLREVATQLAADADERGNLYCSTNMRSYTIPIVGTYQDNPLEALEIREAAVDAWSKKDFFAQHLFGMLSFAEAHLYQNKPFEVLEYFDEVWPRYKKALYHKIQFPHSVVLFSRARARLQAWQIDRNDAHLKAALHDSDTLYREGTPYAMAMAFAIKAGLSMAKENRPEALKSLHSALTKFEESQMGLHVAATKSAIAKLDSDPPSKRFSDEAKVWWESQSVPNPSKVQQSLIPLGCFRAKRGEMAPKGD